MTPNAQPSSPARLNAEPPRRGGASRKPYQAPPMPIATGGLGTRATELFSERALAAHFKRNAGWLQYLPRTSEQIEEALFFSYSLAGMEAEEVREHLNAGLWNAGYVPSNRSSNPSWSWEEEG